MPSTSSGISRVIFDPHAVGGTLASAASGAPTTDVVSLACR
jgi:hypothetical protein